MPTTSYLGMLNSLSLLAAGPAPISIDGTANNSGVGSTTSVSLTTTKPNDIIVVFALVNPTGPFISISSSPALIWSQRANAFTASGSQITEFWAPATSAGTYNITLVPNASGFTVLTAFGVNGANISAPYDINAALPYTHGGLPSDPAVASTTAASTIIFGGFRMLSTPNPTPSPGWTQISSGAGNFMLVEYKIVSAPQSGLSVPLATGAGDSDGGIADAIAQGFTTSIWPPAGVTDLNTILAGTTTIWSDNFASLSLRTGGYATGNIATGYNDPSARGTWSYNGINYMTTVSTYPGLNAYTQNPNANFDWQSTDPNFPPLGMADITANGLVLKSSYSFPLIQAAVAQVGGHTPYLGVLLATASSGKFAPPFIRRTRFTLDTMGPEDFPAVWSTGEHFAVDINNPAFLYYEVDDFERFGNDNPNSYSSTGVRIDGGHGIVINGGVYNTGAPIGPGTLNEIALLQTDRYILAWWNGVLVQNLPIPIGGARPGDRFHVIVNEILNPTFHAYTNSSPPAQMTVRSVEILRPTANALDLIPAAPPVPVLTWGGGFPAGSIPHTTPNGTTVATLTGAVSYTLLGLPGTVRSNRLLQSATFSTSPWTLTGSSWVANTTLAPDSTTTAGTLTENSANSAHSTAQVATFATGQSYTLWAIVKSNGRDFVLSVDDGGSNFVGVKADLTGITVNPFWGGAYLQPTTSITSLANGFYQVVMSFIAAGPLTQTITLGCLSGGFSTYPGNGTSGIILWRAQLEPFYSANSYIATTTVPVTVNTNPLVVSGSNVNTNGTLSAGALSFYVRGLDANGVPGIAPKLAATIT